MGGSSAIGAQASGAGSTIAATGTNIVTSGASSPGASLVNGGSITFDGGGVRTLGVGSFGFLFQGGMTNLAMTGASVSSSADAFAVQGGVANLALVDTTANRPKRRSAQHYAEPRHGFSRLPRRRSIRCSPAQS